MTDIAVTDRAILAIKTMITDGDLRPGDRLPPEKELSEHIGVSRNSLREATKALSVIRVLDIRQGDGTYVTSLAPELLIDALSFVLDLHEDSSVLQVLEVRRLLEPTAVEKACLLLDDEDLDRLDQMMAPLGPDSDVPPSSRRISASITSSIPGAATDTSLRFWTDSPALPPGPGSGVG